MAADPWHARAGLTLTEYFQLLPDDHVHAFAPAMLRDATSTWSSGPAGHLPRSVAGDSPEQIAAHLARVDPSTHPQWESRWRFLEAAYGRPETAPLSIPGVDLEPWQGDLLQLIAPAMDLARHEARQQVATSGCAADAALERWLDHPPVDCLRPLTGAFVLDMNAAARRGSPTENAFETHLTRLRDPVEFLGFLGRFPLLARLLAARISDWGHGAAEFALRWSADADDLGRWLGIDARAPELVEVGLGDRHRGGRAAARVVVGGREIAYKPTALDLATFVQAAHRTVAGRPMPAPDVLPRDGYGWMLWVNPSSAVDVVAAEHYFRALGELNAVAWMLGATDLHAENLVAGPDGPVLVDLETLLCPGLRHAHAGHSHPAPGILLESPVNTGLLPMSLTLAPGEEMDASVFGSGDVQATVPGWADGGTSRMRAIDVQLPPERLPGLLRDESGTPVDALSFVDAVIAGARDGFRQIDEQADEWRAALGRSATPTPRARVLLRDTALYGRISRYLEHPVVLHNPLLAEAAFDLLDPVAVHDNAGYQRAVIEDERRALANGDIPYFEAPIDSTALVLSDGTVLPGFFETSAIERAVSHVDQLRSRPEPLIWITTSALRAAQANRERGRDYTICCDTPRPGVADGELVAAAVAVADRLSALAVVDGDEISWLTMRVDDADNWRPAVADRSLYAGTVGIQLFFEAVSALGLARPDHLAVLGRLREQRSRTIAQLPPGVFDGVGGEVLAEIMLERMGAPAGPRASTHLLSSVTAGSLLPDLLTGDAGLVLLAGVVAQQWPALGEAAEQLASRHARALLAAAVPQVRGHAWPVDGEVNAGFAHGSSGIGLALAHLSTWSADNDLRHALRAGVKAADDWEDAIYDPARGNWPDLRASNTVGGFSTSWCNGSSGMGLARALRLEFGPDNSDRLHRDLERALETTWKHGLGHGQGLCHGDAGVSELFLAAGRVLDQPGLREAARDLAGMMAHQVLNDLGIAKLDFAADVDVPGLVHGSAGIGYQLLRVLDPERVPSIVTLGVAR